MKEIKVLLQQLRNYPNNFFVYESDQPDEAGQLMVCDVNKEVQGSIPVGNKEEIIIK